MSIEAIGKQIASLRKEKGARQEELAKYVVLARRLYQNGRTAAYRILNYCRKLRISFLFPLTVFLTETFPIAIFNRPL